MAGRGRERELVCVLLSCMIGSVLSQLEVAMSPSLLNSGN